ncbi:hypothetical protein NDI52_29225 [Leptolyngbya sp. PL-A3]|uniref:hypothetical protein n=1 Tax=Leptolyngbya sp. PL-A3 TaxID=2933911 RepID=UPI0032975D6C
MTHESKKAASKRRIIRCTFQAEANTRDGKFFDFLSSSLEEKTPRELMQEAAEMHWMPIHLFYQLRSGEITADQFRQRVLLALSQQEAWLNYCRRLSEIDPAPQVVQHQTIYMGASESSSSRPPMKPVHSSASSNPVDGSMIEEPSSAPELVEMPKNLLSRRRSQSMKPAFGGAFLQED